MATARDTLRAHGRIDYPRAAGAREPLLLGATGDFEDEIRGSLDTRKAPSIPAAVEAALQEEAHAIHRTADTLSPAVTRALGRLQDGNPVLRVSHQPNTLAALNTVAAALHLAAIKPRLAAAGVPEPVVLFFVVDYDEAGDRRFREPIGPSPDDRSTATLDDPVPASQRRRIAASIQPAPGAAIDAWEETLLPAVARWAQGLGPWHPGLQSPETARALAASGLASVRQAMSRATSLTEANTVALSLLCNARLDLDILFVRERALWPAIADDLTRFLYDARSDPGGKDARVGVWRLCDGCLVRRDTLISSDTPLTAYATWECVECDLTRVHEPLDWSTVVTTESSTLPRFIPKVGLSDLADAYSYGIAGSAGYAGGAGHLVRSRLWARPRYGPMAPELVIEPHRILTGVDPADGAPRYGTASTWEAFQTGKYPGVFYASLLSRRALMGESLR